MADPSVHQQSVQQQQSVYSHVTTPVMVMTTGPAAMGNQPQQIVCPQCGSNVVTNVTCRPSTAGVIFAVVLFFLFFPALCVPLCVCQDKFHRCPSCGALVGEYKHPTCR